MANGLTAKEFIAKRVAKELNDGDLVNLGIGLPTLVTNYIPEGINVLIESENGMIGMGPSPEPGQEDNNIVDAGGKNSSILSGGVFFDSSLSFGLIRGGHIDVCILGALQVDESGNLANWIIPGKFVPGMGGAMDLVTGARKVIIAMLHTAKGRKKILKECTLPLTARGEVDLIVTEKAVIEVDRGKGLILKEIAAGQSIEDIKRETEARLIVSPKLKYIDD